ncbi:MAG: hypothetical protein V3S14_13690, partial [Anaerolineae bacterium]
PHTRGGEPSCGVEWGGKIHCPHTRGGVNRDEKCGYSRRGYCPHTRVNVRPALGQAVKLVYLHGALVRTAMGTIQHPLDPSGTSPSNAIRAFYAAILTL